MADYISLLLFIIIMVGTPGPANLVLMAAGSRHGFTACIPFISGVTLGKLLLNAVLIFGFYRLLERQPELLTGLKYISAAYMIWLSLRMLSPPRDETAGADRVPGLAAGVMVHPLNPKAWAMATIALADYGPLITDPLIRFVIIAGSFMAVQVVCHSLWCYGGSQIMRLISRQKDRLTFQRLIVLINVILVLWIVLT
ncbi:MAG: LysE family translocator [Candidatus Puniceispirillales bacterium]